MIFWEDFLARALIVGVLIALLSGPLGCVLLWRRAVYLGDAMAHGALIGVALSLFLSLPLAWGVVPFVVFLAFMFRYVSASERFDGNALLAIFAHGAFALGLVVLSLGGLSVGSVERWLIGDILTVSWMDVVYAFIGFAVGLAGVLWFWRDVVSRSLSAELMVAERGGRGSSLSEFVLVMALGILMGLAIHIVGVLLAVSLFIIPACSARNWSRTPEGMALLSSGLGAASVLLGVYVSLGINSPTGPTITLCALAIFLVSLFTRRG